MKASRQPRFFSSSATTVTYTYQNDHSPTQPEAKTTQISIESDSPPSAAAVAAAIKIQSSYRSYIVRNLVKKIAAANSEASCLERLIQRQETVDAIRADPRERIKMNEALMGLLLRLDSVPGVTPTVRELRRQVSRRIVGLQEILDAVSEERVEDWELGFGWNWVDDIVAKMEEDVCRERGGLEMERFCAEHLGFRCLQRFLRDQ